MGRAGGGLGQSSGRGARVVGLLAACAWIASSSACGNEHSSDPPSASTPLAEDELTPLQLEEIEALQALGYAEGDQPAPERTGVTLNLSGRTYPGYNLYTSEHAPRVFLLDMEGRVLHVWKVRGEGIPATVSLRRVRLFANGEILVLMEGLGLIRLDRDSKILWHYAGSYHHDFEVSDDGTIYVLARESAIYPDYSRRKPIRNDFVTILSPDGEIRRQVSLLAALERSECCSRLLRRRISGDAFHSNRLELLDGRLGDGHPAFRAGNVLTSWRNLNAIGIIDLDSETVVWSLGGFRRQHHPTVLNNGNILVFDNIDVARGSDQSRVVEIDPQSGEVRWEFHSTPDFPFFTRTGGSALPLSNGNKMITETRNGRAFEVTRSGEVVWIFVNPARAKKGGAEIARIFELQRLSADPPADWLSEEPLSSDRLTTYPKPERKFRRNLDFFERN